MHIPSLNDLTLKAQSAVKRFPITIIWVILGTIHTIRLIEKENSNIFEDNTNILLTLILGISWLIGIQFFIEQLKNKKRGIWLKLLVLILLGIFFWWYPNVNYKDQNPIYNIRFFLYVIAGHLFIFFAPFVIKWDKNAYWNYLNLTGIAITRSLFFSGLLYLGLVLALLAIEALFNVFIEWKTYGQLFVFCLGIINTLIYLADFPKNVLDKNTIQFKKAIEVLVKYILIPLVILYMLILYAYCTKIVLHWKLPKGWVSYLVIALSFLGYIIQIIINPVQETIKSWTINKFFPWFYILLTPLNILLFIAIFRRINDYGLTEKRYFVLAIAIWNMAIILYILFHKKKALKNIPISLFVLTILSSFGFWGAHNMANKSQTKRFEKIYTTIKNNNNTASKTELEQLRSILDFLEDRKIATQLNRTIGFNIEDFRETSKYREKSGHLNQYKVLTALHIQQDPSEATIEKPRNKHYSLNNFNNFKLSTSIKEYDNFTFISYYRTEEIIDAGIYDIDLNMETVKMSIYSKTDSLRKIKIPLEKKLLELSSKNIKLNNLNTEEFIIQTQNDTMKVKLILTELNYYVEDGKKIDFMSFSAYLFIKEK